ncbi:unnamed protein product [Ectocarpus sp. CCAP 1310/34]|nr:unnamed protein product [Ectocarpus sp. CCAP 1310/34]
MNGVCLDRSNVDFGFSSTGGQETITLTNNSDTEVHVVWNLKPPGEGGGVKEAGPACLQVTPLEARVPERGSLSFRVEVFPTKGNCYFAEEAEAFVSPANQMTFRTVKDATQQPPWCLPLRVLGHTFVGEQFLAKASLSTQHTGQKLCFPACHVGDTVYQTIRWGQEKGAERTGVRWPKVSGLLWLARNVRSPHNPLLLVLRLLFGRRLSNQGNIPACFNFQPDASGVFAIKPSVGLVPAGDFQLCLVRFTPPGPGGYHHRLQCVLNNDPGSTEEADLFGQGAWPAVQVTSGGGGEAGDGEPARSLAAGSVGASSGSSIRIRERLDKDKGSVVYMRPTCVGIVSSGVVKVNSEKSIVG